MQDMEEATMLADNEFLKLARFELNGIHMLDIRYWRETRKGPKPTSKSICIPMNLVMRLVAAVQKEHGEHERAQAEIEFFTLTKA